MALRGLKVLEFAGLAPAPFCGRILSDFGAEVLRIDKTASTNPMDCLGHGKKSLALNLKQPEAVTIVKRLAERSDVLLEPFRAGVMEKLGLGPSELLSLNPRLIYARLTGYGQSGPLAKRAGHDINYLGLSGLLSLFGRKGQKPTFPVNYAADFAGGGLVCALGILLALYERSSSGLGQVIDSSMVEGCAYIGSWLYRSRGLPIWGENMGEGVLDTGTHFYDVYETKDGKYLSVGAIEPQFYDKLIEGLGLSPEEAPVIPNCEELKALFTRRFKEKTQKEWCQIFDDVDACVAPVLSLDEAPGHYHNLERRSFEGNMPKPAPVLSRTPGSFRMSKEPAVGEHTRSVLQGLGYSEKEIHSLVEKGAIEIFTKSKM